MANKYFYFYDLNEVLIDRYPASIANRIQREINSFSFVFLYSEQYKRTFPENLPRGSRVFFIKDLNQDRIEYIISQYPPVCLVTIAQIIPDLWITTLFRHNNIPTYTVQHGLWSDKLQRIALLPLIVSKFSKFFYYLRYVKYICHMNNMPLLDTLYEFYRFLLKEDLVISQSRYLKNQNIWSNKVFVFDHSWDDYYMKKYNYALMNLIYIGNPDFLLLKNLICQEKENAVCYLCQSLVEDGRMNLSDYEKFLFLLKKWVLPEKKLYVKLHPKSQMINYKVLQNSGNIVFCEHLPYCKYYIGHYTSLLATVAQISDDILVWKFKNHHVPEYFNQFASIVTDDQECLYSFIMGKYERTNKVVKKLTLEEIKSVDPIKNIVSELLKLQS